MNPDQLDLESYLLARLRHFRQMATLTDAEVAQVLEAAAFSLRCPRPEVFTLPASWTPAVRMTQRSMHVDPQAQRYLADKIRIGRELISQLDGRAGPLFPHGATLAARIEIPHAAHNRDLDNEVKTALDAANGILWSDDHWIDVIYATRGQWRGEESWLTVGVLE